MSNPQIIPAILAKNPTDFESDIQKVKESGLFQDNWVHIDFMDNKFVPNQSISPTELGNLYQSFQIEAHLMVNFPESWFDELIEKKVKRIFFPVENGEGIQEKINFLKNEGIEVGTSLNPETSIQTLAEFISQIDVCLIMSVNPGFQGQDFIEGVLSKVTELKKIRPGLKIEVDGGICEENARLVMESGADFLAVGSHLLKGNINENFSQIQKALQ